MIRPLCLLFDYKKLSMVSRKLPQSSLHLSSDRPTETDRPTQAGCGSSLKFPRLDLVSYHDNPYRGAVGRATDHGAVKVIMPSFQQR